MDYAYEYTTLLEWYDIQHSQQCFIHWNPFPKYLLYLEHFLIAVNLYISMQIQLCVPLVQCKITSLSMQVFKLP